MKQEIEERWVAALRSGEYQQGKNALSWQGDGGFCCLGVLCDLAVQEGVIPPPVSVVSTADPDVHKLEFSGCVDFLPDPVVEWAGLRNPSPRVRIEGVNRELAWLNDDFGATFEEIADIIETYEVA